VSMFMNSSGGLQKFGNTCQLKIENKGCDTSKNFLGNSHNRNMFSNKTKCLKSNISIKIVFQLVPIDTRLLVLMEENTIQNIWK